MKYVDKDLIVIPERYLVFLYVQSAIFIATIIYLSINWSTPKELFEKMQDDHLLFISKIETVETKIDELITEIKILRDVESAQIIKIKTALIDRRSWMKDVQKFLAESDRWRFSDEKKAWDEVVKNNTGFIPPTLKKSDESKLPTVPPLIIK